MKDSDRSLRGKIESRALERGAPGGEVAHRAPERVAAAGEVAHRTPERAQTAQETADETPARSLTPLAPTEAANPTSPWAPVARDVTSRAPERVPTIRDVASRAGVSIATVSRVLNGANHPVSEGTKRKVLEAAQALGFTPNAAARELLTRTTSTLGVLVPDVSNPYYATILQGAQEVADAAGYYLLLGNTNRDPKRQAEHLAVFAAKRVDGVFVLGGSLGKADANIVQSLGIPVAAIGRHPAAVPSVRVDNVEIGRLATRHLMERGCRAIAFIAGPANSVTMRERVQGYRSAIGGRGQVLWGDLTPDWGAAAAGQLDADGLVCGNDLVALGALHGLAARGLRVPGDVMVVGCDDIGIATHTLPSLTSVAVPSLDLGRRGVALLLDLIQRRPAPKRGVVLPVDLRVRGSTESRASMEPHDGPALSDSTDAREPIEPGAHTEPSDITAPPVPARG